MSAVEVYLGGRKFRYWTEVQLSRGIDSFATVSLGAPMDDKFRGIFRPFQFPSLWIDIDGERVFTGRLMEVSPSFSGNEWRVQLNGYEEAAVLMDTNSQLALEFQQQNLLQIATQLAGEFGVTVVPLADVGGPFEREAIDPGSSPLEFLVELAKRRGLTLTGNAIGQLVIGDPSVGSLPIATLTEGASPLLECSVQLNPREYYAKVVGLGEIGKRGIAINPHWPAGVPERVLVFEVKDEDPQTAANGKLGRMFANACSYTVNLSTWTNSLGALWKPGDMVILDAPKSMVYTPTVFSIRNVSLSMETNSETASLELCLPGTFSGEIPMGALPWES